MAAVAAVATLTSITKVAELAGVAAEIALAEVSGNIFKLTLIFVTFSELQSIILCLYYIKDTLFHCTIVTKVFCNIKISVYLFRAATYSLIFVILKQYSFPV